MSKYINAEKLKAEIERLKGQLIYGACAAQIEMETNCKDEAYNEVLAVIASLQQEQPALPGIEDHGIPGKDFIPVEWVDVCERYGKWKIVKQEQPEVDLEKEIKNYLATKCAGDDEPSVSEIARHFYELGLNARKEE